jgi:cell division protease FtsH
LKERKILDKTLKNIAIYVLIVLMALFAIKLTSTNEVNITELTEPQFLNKVDQGQVKTAQVEVDELVYNITGELSDGSQYATTVSKESNVVQILRDNKKVEYQVDEVKPPPWWMSLLSTLFPIIILIAFLIFIMNQSQGGGNRVMQFGRSKARLMTGEEVKITFEDVAGADEAKEEMQEVVEFLKNPQKFIEIGAKIPKGVLLFGAPKLVIPCTFPSIMLPGTILVCSVGIKNRIPLGLILGSLYPVPST